jgi:hypothetical protein
MITEGMEEQEGDVRSWDGEEHIIIELPAWSSNQIPIYWSYEK